MIEDHKEIGTNWQKRWCWHWQKTDIQSFDVRLQEDLSMREKVHWDTQIQNIHEMGETKRAQEQ